MMTEFHVLRKEVGIHKGKKLGYTREKSWDTQELPGIQPDWHFVNGLLWKWVKRELNKVFQEFWQILVQDLLVCSFSQKYFSCFLWTWIMLIIFHVSGKIPWLSEDLKTSMRENAIESPLSLIIWIEMLSNPWAFVGFKDLIIEVYQYSLTTKELWHCFSK